MASISGKTKKSKRRDICTPAMRVGGAWLPGWVKRLLEDQALYRTRSVFGVEFIEMEQPDRSTQRSPPGRHGT